MGNTIIYYGGSFNPPHIAHYLFVAALRAYFPDAEVWIAPTYRHAFHKELMPFGLRLQMLREMFSPIGGIQVSTVERDLGHETGYTVDVVRYLLAQFPGREIQIAVGADIVPTLPEWHAYDELVKLARFLVFPRQGFDNSQAVAMPLLPEVSSTQIRGMLVHGRWDDIRPLVPSCVLRRLQEWKAEDSAAFAGFTLPDGLQ